MNYLAHLYLSGRNREVMVGNFIADDVKGRRLDSYSAGVRRGILLHRQIDQYMDSHEIAAEGRVRLYPIYHHYAGVVNDMFYDHFLAADWRLYSAEPLWRYSVFCYTTLLSHWFELPVSVRGYLPYIILRRRLTAYAKVSGIRESLDIMSRHSSLPGRTDDAICILLDHYEEYRTEFHSFFAQIRGNLKDEIPM